MHFYIVVVFVFLPALYLSNALLLSLVNRGFMYGMTESHIWLGAMVTLLLGIAGGVATYFTLGWHTYGIAIDSSPEAGLVAGIIGLLVGCSSLGIATAWFLWKNAKNSSTLGNRVLSSLVVGTGVPLIVGLGILIFNYQ